MLRVIPVQTDRAASPVDYRGILTLAFSLVAILISATGTWYQFFRTAAHLKVAIASVSAAFDTSGFSSSYNIALINNGNKPIIVTHIWSVIEPIKYDAANYDRITHYMQNPTDNGLTEMMMVVPKCSMTDDYAPPFRQYLHDDKSQGGGIIVVKPDDFFVMGDVLFSNLAFRNFSAEIQMFLECIKFEYIKSDGRKGLRLIPSAVVAVMQNRVGLSVANAVPVTGIQDVD